MNTLTWLVLVSSVIFIMDYTFLCIGHIPFQVTQKPIHSISVYPKNDFFKIILKPVFFNILCVSSNLSKWSNQSPLVIINRSLMYAWINSNPLNISFIFSWKMSRDLLTPIVRHFYRYFTQGKMIVHRLLACSLMWI